MKKKNIIIWIIVIISIILLIALTLFLLNHFDVIHLSKLFSSTSQSTIQNNLAPGGNSGGSGGRL